MDPNPCNEEFHTQQEYDQKLGLSNYFCNLVFITSIDVHH